MKAKREQVDGELILIKLFASNYARDIYPNIHPSLSLTIAPP